MVFEIFTSLDKVLPPQFYLISFIFGFLWLVWLSFSTKKKYNKLREWGETEKVIFSLILGVTFYYSLTLFLSALYSFHNVTILGYNEVSLMKNFYSHVFIWGLIFMGLLFITTISERKRPILSLPIKQRKKVLSELLKVFLFFILILIGIDFIESYFHYPLHISGSLILSVLFNPIFLLWLKEHLSFPLRDYINFETIRKNYLIITVPLIVSLLWLAFFVPHTVSVFKNTTSIRILKFGNKILLVNETFHKYTIVPMASKFVYFPNNHSLYFSSECISSNSVIKNCSFNSLSTMFYFTPSIELFKEITIETKEFIPWIESYELEENPCYKKVFEFNMSFVCLNKKWCYLNLTIKNKVGIPIELDKFEVVRNFKHTYEYDYKSMRFKENYLSDIILDNWDLYVRYLRVPPKETERISYVIWPMD